MTEQFLEPERQRLDRGHGLMPFHFPIFPLLCRCPVAYMTFIYQPFVMDYIIENVDWLTLAG